MTKEICDAMAMKRALTRMTYEIMKRTRELKESSLSAQDKRRLSCATHRFTLETA